MSLRVVLFTRSGRPSGAQMAWRLFENGFAPAAVIVEKRGRMVGGKKNSLFSFFAGWGFRFVLKKVRETAEIKLHYYFRRLFGKRFKAPGYLSIEELALDYPLELHAVEDHNDPDTVRLIERLNPDVGVLMNTRRIHKQVLSVPKHGFLNLHLSALPKYGGLESIFWALYHGEKEIGVTVHCVSEGIDEGAVVNQKMIPVGILDDEDTLYAKALWLGTAMMVKTLKNLESGTIERKSQDKTGASYFSWPTNEERKILRERRGRVTGTGEQCRAKRIIHIITRMTRGGAQENTLATLLGLRESGFEATLITGPSWDKEGEILSQAIEEKLDLVILPALVREIDFWNDGIALLRLLTLLRKIPCRVIHTHTSKAGLLGRVAAFLARMPVVLHTPHGHVFHSYFSKWKERLFILLERALAERTDRLIALTDACRKEHLALGIGKPEQWVVIPSGVDERSFADIGDDRKENVRRLFGIPPRAKVVGFVGRLSSIKGPRYLAEAFPRIKRAFPGSHFLFVGDGEERALLESKVRESGLNSAVTFAGRRSDPGEAISVMDVLVVPSLNEGMGRVIVEAGFLAKAVVGTRVGGIPELLEDGVTGLLVEPRDPGEIAEAVNRLLSNGDLAKALGKSLREKVLAGFTEKRMLERIEDLYRKLSPEGSPQGK